MTPGDLEILLPSSTWAVHRWGNGRFQGQKCNEAMHAKKPTKRGYKVWCRCSPNEMTDGCEVYEGSTDQPRETNLSTAVVLRSAIYMTRANISSLTIIFRVLTWLRSFWNTRRTVVALQDPTAKSIQQLWRMFTLTEASTNPRLLGGYTVLYGRTRRTSTSYKQFGTGTVMRRNKDSSRTAVSCPLPVKIYNEKMGGMDLADSKRQVYSCSHKSKKWWHRLVYYFHDVSVVNAHILETETPHSACRSHKDYRLKLVREMMALHLSRKRGAQSSVDSVPPSVRFCERHFPDLLPGVHNCWYCSSSINRKRTKHCCN